MILLDRSKNKALYLQLCEQIKSRVIAGQLPEGARLPSCRQLAKDLQISRNTVELAYQQLRAEGYLESKPGSGFYVADLEYLLPLSSQQNNLASREEKKAYQYDFQYGKIDHLYCPFNLWRKLTNQCLQSEQQKIVFSGNHQGILGLRTQIQKYLAEFRGVSCQAEQIIVGAGTQYCLNLLSQLIKKQFSTIAVEDPCLDTTKVVFRNNGLKIKPVDLTSLEKIPAQALYVNPSYQFPTGKIMSLQQRLELLAWAQNQQALIIEDDYNSDFKFLGKPLPALQGLNNDDNVVYLGTFSKAMSLSISYLVLPWKILEIYQEMFQDHESSVSVLQQKTLEQFMALGYWERHLRKISRIYSKKYTFLTQQITEQMGNRTRIVNENIGLHLLLEAEGLTEQELVARAENQAIKVYPASKHWWLKKQDHANMVLLGFCGLEENELCAGIELLRKAWFTKPCLFPR